VGFKDSNIIVLLRKIVYLIQNNLAACAVALSKKISVGTHKSESVLSVLTVVLQKPVIISDVFL
jgi:hypothetical protein